VRITRKVLETEVAEIEKRWLEQKLSIYPHEPEDRITRVELQELNGFYRIIAHTEKSGGGGHDKPNGAPGYLKAKELYLVMQYL
jgi:hypothetical protein